MLVQLAELTLLPTCVLKYFALLNALAFKARSCGIRTPTSLRSLYLFGCQCYMMQLQILRTGSGHSGRPLRHQHHVSKWPWHLLHILHHLRTICSA